jgi:hypothetical protein
MRSVIVTFFLCTALTKNVSAAQSTANPTIKIITLDQDSVRIVYTLGKDVIVTENKKYADAKISEDKLTAGWLKYDDLVIPELNFYGSVSRVLYLYKNGKIVRTIITDEACIKSWGFAHNGEHVAVVDGGLRSGYLYKLYDVSSGKLIQSISNPTPEQIPEWGKGLIK